MMDNSVLILKFAKEYKCVKKKIRKGIFNMVPLSKRYDQSVTQQSYELRSVSDRKHRSHAILDKID